MNEYPEAVVRLLHLLKAGPLTRGQIVMRFGARSSADSALTQAKRCGLVEQDEIKAYRLKEGTRS